MERRNFIFILPTLAIGCISKVNLTVLPTSHPFHGRYHIPIYHRQCDKLAFYTDHYWGQGEIVDANCFRDIHGFVFDHFPLICGYCDEEIVNEGEELFFDVRIT